MTRRSWSLVLVALLLVSTIGMPLVGAGTVAAQDSSSEQSPVELAEEWDGSEMKEITQMGTDEISETQYRAVIIWLEQNAYNFAPEQEERFDEWTSSLQEQHGVSPSEIREQYSAETESDSEGESESESDIDASEIQEQEEPEPLPEEERIEADIVFLNELRLQELEHEDGMAKFKLQNPTTDVQRVVLNPSGTDEQALIRLDPGETREVNLQMDGTLSWSLSVSTGITTEQFDEVAESGDGTTDRLQYTIEHDILTIIDLFLRS